MRKCFHFKSAFKLFFKGQHDEDGLRDFRIGGIYELLV